MISIHSYLNDAYVLRVPTVGLVHTHSVTEIFDIALYPGDSKISELDPGYLREKAGFKIGPLHVNNVDHLNYFGTMIDATSLKYPMVGGGVVFKKRIQVFESPSPFPTNKFSVALLAPLRISFRGNYITETMLRSYGPDVSYPYEVPGVIYVYYVIRWDAKNRISTIMALTFLRAISSSGSRTYRHDYMMLYVGSYKFNAFLDKYAYIEPGQFTDYKPMSESATVGAWVDNTPDAKFLASSDRVSKILDYFNKAYKDPVDFIPGYIGLIAKTPDRIMSTSNRFVGYVFTTKKFVDVNALHFRSPTLPALSDQVWGDLANRLVSKAKVFDGNGLAFIGDLIGLLTFIKTFLKSFLSLLRGNFKEVANVFLSWYYGFRLTVKDSVELYRNSETALKKGTLEYWLDSATSTIDGAAIRLSMYRKPYSLEFEDLMEVLWDFDLLPTPSVVWDWIPFSFVVDWFVPIGSALERVSNNLYYSSYDTLGFGKSVVKSEEFDGEDLGLAGSYRAKLYMRHYSKEPPRIPVYLDESGEIRQMYYFVGAALVIQRSR